MRGEPNKERTMTHIEQLIKDMCPHGVEWKTFDELGVFYGGLSGKTKDDFKDGNAKFITYLNIANNPALRLDIQDTVQVGPNEKQNIVQYGDALFTGSSETPDECAMSSVVTEHPTEKLYLNSFCFGFRFNSLEGIEPAFYKHYFRSNHFRQAVRRTANGTTRFNVSKKEFAKLEIPIPPLEIQERIVELLDEFAALAAELQAELQKRRTQYEYYRTRLLTPPHADSTANSTDDAKWEWKTLGELCQIKTGKLNANAQVENGQYPFYTCDAKPFKIDTYAFDTEAILISGNGSQVGHLNYYKGKFNAYQRTYVLDKFNVNIFYVLQYLKGTIRQYIIDNSRKGSVPYITLPMLQEFPIPIPSPAEQKRIANLLDKFEALTTSLSEGIPAEQERQQKRYEYYRDLLLTFDRC